MLVLIIDVDSTVIVTCRSFYFHAYITGSLYSSWCSCQLC